MVDLTRAEVWGTLYVFGIPVLEGLYATNVEEQRKWRARIPRLIRWACRVRWTLTWTVPPEYRDATGALCNPQPLRTKGQFAHLAGLMARKI